MAKLKKEAIFVKKKPKRKKFVFLLILLFLTVLFSVLKLFLPEILFGMGKTLYDAKDYKTSSELFKFAYKFSERDGNYSYYWVLSLSHLPLTYDVQKDLYEISQFDDGSKAETYATKILLYLKNKVLVKAGETYIEEALNDEQVLRWDLNNQPLRYCIIYDTQVPDYYTSLVLQSFDTWHKKTKGLVSFVQVQNKENAQIVVSFVDEDSSKMCQGKACEYSVGTTVPVTQDRKLKFMDVKINIKNNLRQFFSPMDISTVLAHEIGHALGIWGHSRFVSDIMFYSADKLYGENSSKSISSRDVNTLRLLYSFAPDITNSDPSMIQNKKNFYSPIFIGNFTMSKDYNIYKASKRLNENPSDANNWLELASRYTTDKQYDKSNQILVQALYVVRDPQTAGVVYYNMANNYLNQHKYKEALDLANRARQMNDDFDTRALIALIKSKSGNYSIAEKEFIRLRAEQPENIDVALNLTDMYLDKKQYIKARDTIKSLASFNPGALNDSRLAGYKLYAMF